MNALGQAKLVQTTNSTGAVVKAWDLRPFGGNLLELGLVNTPLPPAGTMVDRTLPGGRILRIDASSGGVFEVSATAAPPTIGPTGGPLMRPSAGNAMRSPTTLAILAGLFFAWWKWGRKRR